MAKVIYVYFWKGGGESGTNRKPLACTNKRVLASKTGMGYENLVRIFTRKGRSYWEDSEHFILKIFVSDIIKGKQRIISRGQNEHLFKKREVEY